LTYHGHTKERAERLGTTRANATMPVRVHNDHRGGAAPYIGVLS